jgi:hypothetical protein
MFLGVWASGALAQGQEDEKMLAAVTPRNHEEVPYTSEELRAVRNGFISSAWPISSDGYAYVKFAFVEDRQTLTGQLVNARGCREVRPIEEVLQTSNIAREDFVRDVEWAFQQWERIANIRFVPAKQEEAHFLIGSGEPAFSFLAACTNIRIGARGTGRVVPIRTAVIALDPMRRWRLSSGGSIQSPNVRYVFLHEVGHAIGLAFKHPFGKYVMSNKYIERFALTLWDITAAQGPYGVR